MPPDTRTVLVVVVLVSLTLVSPVGTVCVTLDKVAAPMFSQVIEKSMLSLGFLSRTDIRQGG